MKTRRFIISLVIIASLLAGCSSNDKTPDARIRKKVAAIAEKYVSAQLKSPKKSVSPTGIIAISDDQRKFIIDPSKIFVGLIDEDSDPDALVSVVSLRGQDLDLTEHLVILKKNGKYLLIKSIESDMNVLEVKDRVITAQIHTRPRNTPLYWCSSCLEIVKYRYQGGELVKI